MPNCEFVTFISILACSIAKDKSPEELATLSAFFTQLRRYHSNTGNFGFKIINIKYYFVIHFIKSKFAASKSISCFGITLNVYP